MVRLFILNNKKYDTIDKNTRIAQCKTVGVETFHLLRLEVKIESLSKSVKLDLAGGEESLWPRSSWDSDGSRPCCSESSACQESSQVSIKQMFLLVRGIVRVDEGRGLLGVVVVLVIVFFRLASRVDSVGLPIVPDVAVLPGPLVVTDALLPVDDAVLL